MDFDDRIHRDLVEPYSNDASASSFGWNFQYAAGIFLFLNYADDTTKVIMESEKQDIELVLFEDKHIYAQAKSAQDYTAINASNKNKKIKDALISLINTFGKNSDGQFIYVSNIKGTITEENDSINHVSSYTGFLQSSKDYITTLFSEIKSKMKKNIENESKTVWAKPFYGEIEYEMPKELAKQILATRKGGE